MNNPSFPAKPSEMLPNVSMQNSHAANGPNDDDLAEIKSAVLAKLALAVGKDVASATEHDWFVASAYAVRDRIVYRWLASERASNANGSKRVYYLSFEFLIGRLLADVLCNLGLDEVSRAALGDLGVDLDRLQSAEPDAALGHGGLGRLAACFMESMASLGISAYGYGIRYDHGLFRQVIKDGWQQEYPEEWLSFGNPWEFERPEVDYTVGFGGTVEAITEADDATRHVWHPAETVQALAYDTPIVGWRGRHVNTLRLWSARALDPLRLDAFNSGDHVGAHADRVWAESISKVLYPSDAMPAGRELRLRQEYFFASASLQDLVHRHLAQHGDISTLSEKAAIQLNDTHPAIAVAELMRILVDMHGVPWTKAWAITTGTISYTNHTLLPEALESWAVPLMARLLPRHMQIIYLINGMHLDSLRAAGTDDAALLSAVSLIDEQGGRRVRMGNLAFLGSHKVNGVSALHTDLMRQTVFSQLHELYPDRIVNKTNGVTFRRWLMQSNPGLTKVLREVCGDVMLDDPTAIGRLAAHAGDAALQQRVAAVKRANKVALSRLIEERERAASVARFIEQFRTGIDGFNREIRIRLAEFLQGTERRVQIALPQGELGNAQLRGQGVLAVYHATVKLNRLVSRSGAFGNRADVEHRLVDILALRKQFIEACKSRFVIPGLHIETHFCHRQIGQIHKDGWPKPGIRVGRESLNPLIAFE